MLRVAAVAKTITDHDEFVGSGEAVVKACLVHDLGNLIKSRMDIAPELYAPEGSEYWAEKKDCMIATYGDDPNKATLAMLGELNIDSEVERIVREMSFDSIKEIAEGGDVNVKVALYSDMRVGLHSIVSIEERFEDVKKRYVPIGRFDEAEVDRRFLAGKKIETDLFEDLSIKPDEITEETTKSTQESLLDWEI